MRHIRSLVLFVGLLALLPTGPLAGQARWPTPLESTAELSLDWARPHFPDRVYGTFSGIVTLGARVRVARSVNIVGEIPNFRAPGTGSESEMGNPYIGAEIVGEDGAPAFAVGARFTGDGPGGDPRIVALFTDYERFDQAMTGKVMIISAVGHTTAWKDPEGATVRVRLGGTILHPTESGGQNEMLFDYGVRFGKTVGNAEVAASLTGRWFLTASELGPERASINSVALEAVGRTGMIRPRVGFRIPLDSEISDNVTYVLLFGVSVGLK
jgi:hypothetical protein